LIRSIDEAAKKGKIKIEEINDYTAQTVEIEIKLPRGQYAEDLLDALYGFTECEVSLSSQIIVIKDGLPWETDVHSILQFNTEMLIGFLQKEQELERDRILEKIFYKTLERIFIEDKVYKKIETIKTFFTDAKAYYQEKTHAANNLKLEAEGGGRRLGGQAHGGAPGERGGRGKADENEA
jgi:topoisomerase-4 subunit A